MGSYKANKNNLDGIDEKTQDEKNEKVTENVLKTGLDVAEHIPVASMYAKAAKIADKATGGAITKGASKVVNQGLKNSPIVNQTQSLKNSTSESEVNNTESKTTNITNSNSLFKLSGKTSTSLTDGNIMGKISSKIPKSIKIKIYVGLGVFLFFIMLFVTVFAEDDEINLGATNNVSMSEKNNSTEGFGGEYGENATYSGDIESCALIVKDGIYYKTKVPQTSSCQAGSFSETKGIEPNFYNNLMALIEEAKGVGCNAYINSGRRTLEKQAQLYRTLPRGQAAAPGYSNHEFGIAVDLAYVPRNSKCISYYHNNAPKYGMHFNLVNHVIPEDWHVEPINIKRGTPE